MHIPILHKNILNMLTSMRISAFKHYKNIKLGFMAHGITRVHLYTALLLLVRVTETDNG